jgi:hypothetical protein
MLKIYMAPLTDRKYRTLQADGATWEELALQLREKRKTSLLQELLDALPVQFSRDEIIRITLPKKTAGFILTEAGVSS